MCSWEGSAHNCVLCGERLLNRDDKALSSIRRTAFPKIRIVEATNGVSLDLGPAKNPSDAYLSQFKLFIFRIYSNIKVLLIGTLSSPHFASKQTRFYSNCSTLDRKSCPKMFCFYKN